MGNNALSQSMSQQVKPKGCCKNASHQISNSAIDLGDITCSICFEIYRSPRIMKCKHKICSQCISQWGRHPSVTCPFCRTVVKRFKGNFGKKDKLTEKLIDELLVKCRDCEWKGSPKKYFEDFGISPLMEENPVPSQKMEDQKVEKQPNVHKGCNPKQKNTETQLIPRKNREKQSNDLKKSAKQLQSMVTKSQFQINNPYGEDLFLHECPESPISRYLSWNLLENRSNRSWEDCFYFGDNQF